MTSLTPSDADQWRFESPDGTIALTVILDEAGALHYRIERAETVLLDDSRLGIMCEDRAFSVGLRVIGGPARSVLDAEYRLMHGKRRDHRVHATTAELTVENREGDRLRIHLHVSDSATAFRYELLGDGENLTLQDELTTFRFARTGRAWLQPTSPADGGGPAHENLYRNGVLLGTETAAPSWDLPATFETQGQWVLISESDLDEGFCGTRLAPTPQGLSYGMARSVPEEGMGVGSTRPSGRTPWMTPWRFLSLASTAAELLESTTAWDLAAPSRLAEADWIRAGRVSWSWWSDNESTRNLGTLRRFIDFAAEMGWEYSLVDANWTAHTEQQILELVDHAARSGVRLFLWYNSAGTNNDSTEGPRDLMHERASRRAEMARIAGWGIAGIKVDFFHSDKQEGIAHYLGILEDAADAGLMVNFHGSTIPRGWDRTWPHLMTMEAVRGAEWYLFEPQFAEEAVWHNTILPFTRNVIGSMDYTPVTFSDRAARRRTTAAHEAALSIVFESSLQHFADEPQAYAAQHPEVRRLLSRVPASWDETIGLAGEPGDSVVIARRSGDDWWIGGITAHTRDAAVLDISRLGDLQGTWTIISDGASRDEVAIEHAAAQGAFVTPPSPSGGGFVATLTRA